MADAFEPLYSASEMRAAEERYPRYPESIPELMERAGAAVAREAMLAFPAATTFACVCGGGSNGGDGRVAARALRESGHVADETDQDLDRYEVVVDALFGTGFHGAPRPEAAELIARMNAARAPVVSVDVPSGVDASTGEIAHVAVEADLTVTFHAQKVGLVVAPGRFTRAGSSSPTSGSTTAAHRCAVRAGDPRRGAPSPCSRHEVLVRLRARRRRAAGDGRSRVPDGAGGAACRRRVRDACGSRGVAAYRGGARARAGQARVERRRRAREARRAAGRASALAIGPGLGRSQARTALVRALLERIDLPTVVDADGLFALEPVERGSGTVLTPHAGELSRLLGRESAWVGAHRLAAAQEGAQRFGAVVLLKGADTIVASPTGDVVVCDAGPPALATAGTGDVLTGVVAAFSRKGSTR